MVKVRQYHPQDDADQVDIHAWVAEFIQRHAIAENEAAAFIHACAFASDALEGLTPDDAASNAYAFVSSFRCMRLSSIDMHLAFASAPVEMRD